MHKDYILVVLRWSLYTSFTLFTSYHFQWVENICGFCLGVHYCYCWSSTSSKYLGGGERSDSPADWLSIDQTRCCSVMISEYAGGIDIFRLSPSPNSFHNMKSGLPAKSIPYLMMTSRMASYPLTTTVGRLPMRISKILLYFSNMACKASGEFFPRDGRWPRIGKAIDAACSLWYGAAKVELELVSPYKAAFHDSCFSDHGCQPRHSISNIICHTLEYSNTVHPFNIVFVLSKLPRATKWKHTLYIMEAAENSTTVTGSSPSCPFASKSETSILASAVIWRCRAFSGSFRYRCTAFNASFLYRYQAGLYDENTSFTLPK